MRPGRSAEAEAGDGVTFERKVSALLYTCLAGQHGIRVVDGTIVGVQLAVSHTGADVDDQKVVVEHRGRAFRLFIQCKRSIAIEGADETFIKVVSAIYETVAGRRNPLQDGDQFVLAVGKISAFNEKGLTRLLDVAKGHNSMDELRNVIGNGEGAEAQAALVAFDKALAAGGIHEEPYILLRVLKSTHLWVSDVQQEGSLERRAALDALAIRTTGTTREEAEALYSRFYEAVQDDGKRRADHTFDSLRGAFHGFDRLKPTDSAATIFSEEFFNGEAEALARLEAEFDGGRAYEAVVEVRKFYERGLVLLTKREAAGPSRDKFRLILARALRLEGRGLAYMSLVRHGYEWVEKARKFAEIDNRMPGQIARVALALGDEPLFEEWFPKALVSDQPLILAQKFLNQQKWNEALDAIAQVGEETVETRFIRAVSLRALTAKSSELVAKSLEATDALVKAHGDRPVVQMAAAETALLLVEPPLSSQYTLAPAELGVDFYCRLSDAEENFINVLSSDVGDYEAVHAAILLIKVQQKLMSQTAIYGRKFDKVPAFAQEVGPESAKRIADFFIGIGKYDEVLRLLRHHLSIVKDEEHTADLIRIIAAIQEKTPDPRTLLPDVSGFGPQVAAAITRNGIYLLLNAGLPLPQQWLERLAETADLLPFHLEIGALRAYAEERWDDFNCAFAKLSARFPLAFECFTSLGRFAHEKFRTKYASALRFEEDHALFGKEDDLEISPEGLLARNAVLKILKHVARTFGLSQAVDRWIEVAFNPPDPRELKEVIEVSKHLGLDEELNLALALLAYAGQRYAEASDYFEKYYRERRQSIGTVRALYNEADLRALRYNRLLSEVDELLTEKGRSPSFLRPHIEALRLKGDELRAYEVAKQNLADFPEDGMAVQIFFIACSGTKWQEEGVAAAIRHADLYPSQWLAKVPSDEGLQIIQEQRKGNEERQKAYQDCRYTIGLLSESYIESWFQQCNLMTGIQSRRLGREGRLATKASLRKPILMDAGAALAASRYRLWTVIGGKLHLCIHPSVLQWLEQEANQLRTELGEHSIDRAKQVEGVLKHTKIVQREFTPEELAAAGDDLSFGNLEREAAKRSKHLLVETHGDVSDRCTLGEIVAAAYKASRLRPIAYQDILNRLKIKEDEIQERPFCPNVVISSLDLVAIVDAGVIDILFEAFDSVLVLPSTKQGLAMQFGTTLARIAILHEAEQAVEELQNAIKLGHVDVLAAESHPSLRSLRYFQQVAAAAANRLLWTDETVLRQQVCQAEPSCVVAGTLEIVELLRQDGRIDFSFADDAVLRLLVDGHRDYQGSRAFVALHNFNLGPNAPEFRILCRRMGYLLTKDAARSPEEEAYYRELVGRQVTSLAEALQVSDFEYLRQVVQGITSEVGRAANGFLGKMLHDLGKLTDHKALWQTSLGVWLKEATGFDFGNWADKEAAELNNGRLIRGARPLDQQAQELVRRGRLSSLFRMTLRTE